MGIRSMNRSFDHMPLRFLYYTLACFLCSLRLSQVFAQCPPNELLNITSTLYSQENGLPSSIIVALAKDSIGYLYFKGVDDNWIRYDGINFITQERFNHIHFIDFGSHERVNARYDIHLTENVTTKIDRDSNGAEFSYAIVGDSLRTEVLASKLKRTYPLPGGANAGNCWINPSGSQCWITNAGQIALFDHETGTFEQISIPNTASSKSFTVLTGMQGNSYWIFSDGLYLWNGEQFNKFIDYPEVLVNYTTIETISDRYIMIAGFNNIIHEIDLETRSLRTIHLSDYLPQAELSSLNFIGLRHYQDYLLIGTSEAGLLIFDRCNNVMQQFRLDKPGGSSIRNNNLMWMSIDEDQLLWMQTEQGLFKLEINKQTIQNYSEASFIAQGSCLECFNVRAIHEISKDRLLIGTLSGLRVFDLAQKQSFPFPGNSHQDELKDKPVGAIERNEKGIFFIGYWGYDGISLLSEEGEILGNIFGDNNFPERPFGSILSLYYDEKNVLWVGTNTGVIKVSNIEQYLQTRDPNVLSMNIQLAQQDKPECMVNSCCYSIVSDHQQNIWMGTATGLYRLNQNSGELTPFVHSSKTGSISDAEVRTIYISAKNDIWVGTSRGGLHRFLPGSNTFETFTTDDGLPNNSIYSILEDQSGFLWLGTNGGLCRFRPDDGAVRNYTPRDGAQNFEFNSNAVTMTKDGLFCFGGRSGFNIFYPDSMNVTVTPKPVVITSFKIFDKEYPVTKHVFDLPYHQNSFSFDFAALNYYRSNDNRYAYKMTGADKDWILAGSRTYTSYSNLQPGTYTFHVKAADFTGAWNPEEAIMTFIIHPPWFSTWWFRLIVIMIIAGGIYGFYQYRLRQVTKLYGLRNRIASDLHDEIGSTLSSISLSSTIIQQKLNGQNSDVTKLLQQVSKNTNDMMEALSDIVWAINTRNDRFDNVVNRMRAFAIEVLEPAGINIQFEVSPELSNVHLDMQQRKNLYLIFKEAVNNIAKYAACNQVTIQLKKQEAKGLVMEIVDDGRGFEKEAVDNNAISLSGNGIRNMRKRAEELNGNFQLQSVPGQGVKLYLSFSI